MTTITVNGIDYRPITLDEAKNVYHGYMFHHVSDRNADGSPTRWKVNGAVKRWKRTPDRIQIPVKHGLYAYDYVTNSELHLIYVKVDSPGS